MTEPRRHIHLEHDGKLLLVDLQGNGPAIPQMGRQGEGGFSIRLPTPEEAKEMGLTWNTKRTNRFRLGQEMHEVIVATPEITWPGEWAWKDAVISDSEVDPVARESVYRTLHRVVSKVVITNPSNQILMAKVTRGFFTGCWTLPGGGPHRNGLLRLERWLAVRAERGRERRMAHRDRRGHLGHAADRARWQHLRRVDLQVRHEARPHHR